MAGIRDQSVTQKRNLSKVWYPGQLKSITTSLVMFESFEQSYLEKNATTFQPLV